MKECTDKTVQYNKEVTKAKKNCTSTFSACKSAEDEVTKAVSACSPANTASKVTAAIKQGNTNIAAVKFLVLRAW